MRDRDRRGGVARARGLESARRVQRRPERELRQGVEGVAHPHPLTAMESEAKAVSPR
ncbi:MAG: hypothetical protein G8D28_05360 [gamma proteobacterium symbiont of Phacoides pectinatus]